MIKAVVVFCCFAVTLCAKPLELDIKARNAILVNADTGAILFEKEAHKKAYPASLTKVFTTSYILENYKDRLSKTIIASKDALDIVVPEKKITSNYSLKPYILETDGVSFDIVKEEELTLETLLHGIMLISACDASNVAAELVSGSVESFMDELNAYIKKKGIKDTYLQNPHGLHMPKQLSTAYDIASMAKLAIKNEDFLKFFTCKFYIRPKTNKQNKKEIVTNNKLLKPTEHFYKYAIGAKTGYHAKAKYNLMSVAKKDDRTLIAVVLGCSNSDVRFEETKKLFNAAFLEKKEKKIIFDNKKIFQAKISGSSKILKSKLRKDLILEYYPSEEDSLNAFVIYADLKAPIKKDQRVAVMEIKSKDGKLIKKENIYATQNVRRNFFTFLKQLFVKG
ncbi:MAG: D-alanyl-D-alanine carboxypeptidase DacF [Candidatus Anoxychlamydiales bacterium]|nr:D-alanyl-D-alanine carboxypeptidase DacF [Candidatus Anoxychlamydiales bacterium]